MYEQLVLTKNHEETNLSMDTSLSHYQKSNKLFKILQPLSLISTNLQKKHVIVAKARKLLDYVEVVLAPNLMVEHRFRLDTSKISPKYILNPLIRDPDDENFEQVIIKLQKKKGSDVQPNELYLVSKFIKDGYEVVDGQIIKTPTAEPDPDDSDESVKTLMILMKEDEIEDPNEFFIDPSFVCASTAEVERLWSLCTFILQSNRTRMTKDLFEAIVFLRYNAAMWDMDDVAKACREEEDEDDEGSLCDELKDGFALIDIVEGNDDEDYMIVDTDDAKFLWTLEMVKQFEDMEMDSDDNDDDDENANGDGDDKDEVEDSCYEFI